MADMPSREVAKAALAADFAASLDANATLAVVTEISLMDRLLAAIERLSDTLTRRGRVWQDYVVAQVDTTQRRRLVLPFPSSRLRRVQAYTNAGFSGAGALVNIAGLLPVDLQFTLSTNAPYIVELEWLLPPQPYLEVGVTNISGSTGTVTVTLECEAVQ